MKQNVHFLGAYVPLTKEGNIIVDGVLAFCYPFYDHDLAHLAITPVLWFPDMTQWIFADNNRDLIDYTRILSDLGRWLLPHGL